MSLAVAGDWKVAVLRVIGFCSIIRCFCFFELTYIKYFFRRRASYRMHFRRGRSSGYPCVFISFEIVAGLGCLA